MFFNHKIIISFILLSFFIFDICFSQEYSKTTSEKNLWLSGTIGFIGSSNYPGVFGDVSIDYSNKLNIYSFQYFGVSDGSGLLIFTDFANLESINKDQKSVNGFNFLYGKINRYSFTKVSYSFGLSYMQSVHLKIIDGSRKKNYKSTIGLPLSAQMIFSPIQFFAIGVKGFINLNTFNSIIGTSIGIYFGKVK